MTVGLIDPPVEEAEEEEGGQVGPRHEVRLPEAQQDEN